MRAVLRRSATDGRLMVAMVAVTAPWSVFGGFLVKILESSSSFGAGGWVTMLGWLDFVRVNKDESMRTDGSNGDSRCALSLWYMLSHRRFGWSFLPVAYDWSEGVTCLCWGRVSPALSQDLFVAYPLRQNSLNSVSIVVSLGSVYENLQLVPRLHIPDMKYWMQKGLPSCIGGLFVSRCS